MLFDFYTNYYTITTWQIDQKLINKPHQYDDNRKKVGSFFINFELREKRKNEKVYYYPLRVLFFQKDATFL